MNLTERDKAHLWHPLTQHKLKPNHLPIVKAKGSSLYDNQGKEYIDGIASWYTLCMATVMTLLFQRLKCNWTY